VPGDHGNRFIVNYPVSINVIGPVDSIMRFFHGMRGQRHFLVIRSFNVRSRHEGKVIADDRELMQGGDVLVSISAACMDFEEKKAAPAGTTTPKVLLPENGYKPPRRPLGY
jgi:hypothetical protein